MDIELLNGLIKIVKNDKNNTNKYSNIEKLLLTLTKDEIKYFIERCEKEIFQNVDLSYILMENYPEIFNPYAIDYIDKQLSLIKNKKSELHKGYLDGLIDQKEFDDINKSYNLAITSSNNLKKIMITELINNFKK